jgi:hypothetical protein
MVEKRPWRKQIRRWLVIAVGFGLLPVGLVLLALPMLPGGTLVTLASLAILANEFSWARSLLNRIKGWLRKLGRTMTGQTVEGKGPAKD